MHNIPTCQWLPKYAIPRVAPERVPLLRRSVKCSHDNSATGDSPTAANVSEHASSPNAGNDEQKEFKVGDTYDPSVLIDYGGPLFRHTNAQLVQHDVSDLDRNIIPPWQEYEALTEGTLVIANISIHTFIMPIKDKDGVPTGEERKVYQLNTHSILIIDGSDADPEPLFKPFMNEEVIPAPTVSSANTAADRALATFTIKKPCHASD